VDQWSEDNAWLVDRWRNVLAELKNADKKEYAMYTVALRELFDLAKSSQFSG
jgi:glutamate dehydrogenase